MRIVVFDGHCVNPGDLDWKPLEGIGELIIHERTAPDQVVAHAQGAAIALTNKTLLRRETIEALPDLRYIGVQATGYNVVDLDAARERGIPVTNVPAYSTDSVAQTVMAHLLNLTQHIAEHHQAVQAGRWRDCEDFCFWQTRLIELAGLTMGIVGFGEIGRAVAKLARAFGMNVLVHTRTVPEDSGSPDGSHVRFVSLSEVFAESDILSLHCPLTEETRHLVNAARLALMKPSAFLINTSRGPIVDEAALAEALNANRLAGAGLDVLSREPPQADNPLIGAHHCVITPHLAWATEASRRRLVQAVADNLRAFLAGHPQNVVNGVSGAWGGE